MKHLPTFEWNEDDRIMYCHITDSKGRLAVGMAMCHEDDIDMMSEKTGSEIAYRRAKME